MKELLRAACSRQIAGNALRISVVVWAVLKLINQGGAIDGGSGVSWLHVLLNNRCRIAWLLLLER